MIYLILVITLVLFLTIFYYHKNKGNNIIKDIKKDSLDVNNIDTTIDTPLSFGYKCIWIAVKSIDTEKIAQTIGLNNRQKSNWKTGLEHAHKSSLFISPPIDEWTLIIGYGFPQEENDNENIKIKTLTNKLSKEFNESQYFATHRVVDYHCWIKSTDGETTRVYSYLGESGENIEVFGSKTDIELQYKLGNTISEEALQDENYYDRKDLIYPDEEMVMEIAESWSINPTTLDRRTDIKKLGILGSLIH